MALLALPGCGGSSGNPVEQAAQRTFAAPGAQTSVAGTIRLPGSRPISFSGGGWIDNRNHRTKVVLAGAVQGEEIVDAARSTVLYLRFPSLTGQLRTSRPWVRLDVGEQLGRAGFNAGSVALNQGNPAQYVDYLRSTTGKVRKVGTEQDSGVSTTHYAVTIDLHAYPGKVPLGRRLEARRVSTRLIQLAGRELPAQVWVDGRGYVRQLRVAYSVPIPNANGRIAYRTTVRYGDFRRQPRIALPPAREVSRIGANGKLEQ
jgi:hypothetical protein